MTITRAAVDAAAQLRREQLAARVASGKKWCSRHPGGGAWLARAEFGPVPSRSDGLHGYCRSCAAAARRVRYAADPALRAGDLARSAARRATVKAAAEAAEQARAAKQTARARQHAIDRVIAGESPQFFGDLITDQDLPVLIAGRAARIRSQVEADQARAIAAAAWRRGLGDAPVPPAGDAGHALGWHR